MLFAVYEFFHMKQQPSKPGFSRDAIVAEMAHLERTLSRSEKKVTPAPQDSPPAGGEPVGGATDTSQLDLEYRIDYTLKPGRMENAYIASLTSHTSYWENADVALFVMSKIYPDCEAL